MRVVTQALLLAASATASIPAAPRFFDNLVSHHNAGSATYSQRYYLNDTSFRGPGSPIFMIMGGEGAIPPSTGFFYPWIVNVLAPKFGALVLEPEHRFYGESLPFGNASYDNDKMQLLTPEQALADAVALLIATRKARNCSVAPRCPVITFGGSYGAELSFGLRAKYPWVFDAALVASGPLLTDIGDDVYGQARVMTNTTRILGGEGCVSAFRAAFAEVERLLAANRRGDLKAQLSLCSEPPKHAAGLKQLRAWFLQGA